MIHHASFNATGLWTPQITGTVVAIRISGTTGLQGYGTVSLGDLISRIIGGVTTTSQILAGGVDFNFPGEWTRLPKPLKVTLETCLKVTVPAGTFVVELMTDD